MNKLKFLLILILFSILCLNVFGQNNTYPFEVEISGKGKQAIIFIPGFASSGDVWKETKMKYEKDFTCYTLTMAGFAGVKPQPNATFVNWETGIAIYIKDHKIEKPIVIGHSMGGGLALALASDYPNLIGKIIVVDALPCLAALFDPKFKAKEKTDCSATVQQMTTASDEQFYQMQKQSIPKLLADTSKQEMVIGWSVKSDRKTFAEMYCDFSNTDLREKIKSIKCPSLILLEEYFQNVNPIIVEQYKNLENASLRYSTKGLHFIMYDDQDWYFEQIATFIQS
ncbi:MAG: alpha/beta hydrolase [Bacteroidia bacterium]|nr:alpha/beta hydrolase [Bacteroidia bacterium]MCF8425148.1 alpha/beta hydrolase [Bacteroidia bacterium]MCF8447252.1 alpha/beta hydrolase [Bacteroidia bacterium]